MKNKILVYSIDVDGANPNGDPNNDNEPRRLEDERGFMSQYSIKHKLRNRLAASGEKVYMTDDAPTLTEKVEKLADETGTDKTSGDALAELLRKTYIDIRLFGSMTQTIKLGKVNVSRAVARPAVTFNDPKTNVPISSEIYSITSCIALKDKTADSGSSTMGVGSPRVYGAKYVGYAAVNAGTCERNGVGESDLEKLYGAFVTMFDGDQAAARPMGSMKIGRLVEIEYSAPDDAYDIVQYFQKAIHDGSTDEKLLENPFETAVVKIIK